STVAIEDTPCCSQSPSQHPDFLVSLQRTTSSPPHHPSLPPSSSLCVSLSPVVSVHLISPSSSLWHVTLLHSLFVSYDVSCILMNLLLHFYCSPPFAPR